MAKNNTKIQMHEVNEEKDGFLVVFLKMSVEAADLIFVGSLFHLRGARDENALSPAVTRRVRGSES